MQSWSHVTNMLECVPFRKADVFVAFIGLDSQANDSGQKARRHRLSERGLAEWCRLLFSAAMAGSKTTVWKPDCESYRRQSWSTTGSLVILARKIARTVL